jgi:hypothetical protein
MAGAAAAGAVIGAIGVIQGGQQAAAQGRSQKAIADQNAEIERRKGVRAKQIAAINRSEHERSASAQLATLFASGGASGVIRSEGSPLAVFTDYARDIELESLRITNVGDVDYDAALNQARNFRSQGSLDLLAGKQAQTASFFKAGSTLASGFGSADIFKSGGALQPPWVKSPEG